MSVSHFACSSIEPFRLIVVNSSVSFILNASQSALCKHHFGYDVVTGGTYFVCTVSMIGKLSLIRYSYIDQ